MLRRTFLSSTAAAAGVAMWISKFAFARTATTPNWEFATAASSVIGSIDIHSPLVAVARNARPRCR